MSATETRLCDCGSEEPIIPSFGWCISCQFSERNSQTYAKCPECGHVNVRALAHQGFEVVFEQHGGHHVEHSIALYQCQHCGGEWNE